MTASAWDGAYASPGARVEAGRTLIARVIARIAHLKRLARPTRRPADRDELAALHRNREMARRIRNDAALLSR